MNLIKYLEFVDLYDFSAEVFSLLIGVELLIIDVRFFAGTGFEFGSISLVPRAVVRRAAVQHHLALHRSIQCKA